MNQFAVLTGDLVASSDLSSTDVDAALTTIEVATKAMSGWRNATVIARFARRGGDAWQVALSDPALGLRAALYIQSCLRRDMDSATTRISLATGPGTVPDSGDLNAAHGPVFVASGRLLDTLSRQTRMAHASGGAQHAATRLAEHIASGWTQAQARSMAAVLAPDAPTRAEIAKSAGISRQAVNQSLWAAGYPAISDALKAMEKEAGK